MTGRRSMARHYAVQALYQWQMTGQNVSDIDNQFLAEQDPRTFEVPYFKDLVHGVPANLNALDERLSPLLDRALASVDPVERAILRLGAYELMRHPEVPYRVAIDEAVELAKLFGAEQGQRYVNGVLDKMAKMVRPSEVDRAG